MKHLLVTSVALLIFVYSYGQANLKIQTNEIAQISDMENLLRALSYTSINEINVANVEGNAYLEENFINGDVSLITGAKYGGIPLRYNVYNEQFEFKNRKGEVFNINNPASIRELTLGKSRFLYISIEQSKKDRQFFAEVITDGKVSLLKHHRIKLQEAKPAETHRAFRAPKFVKIPPEYLIKKEDGSVQLIKNKKELLATLPNKAKEISELINQEKLSVISESDLIRIISFVNSN